MANHESPKHLKMKLVYPSLPQVGFEPQFLGMRNRCADPQAIWPRPNKVGSFPFCSLWQFVSRFFWAVVNQGLSTWQTTCTCQGLFTSLFISTCTYFRATALELQLLQGNKYQVRLSKDRLVIRLRHGCSYKVRAVLQSTALKALKAMKNVLQKT